MKDGVCRVTIFDLCYRSDEPTCFAG